MRSEEIVCLVDSDWAGDVSSTKGFSGRVVFVRGIVVGFRIELLYNIALIDTEAELNASVEELSEMVTTFICNPSSCDYDPVCRLLTDACSCKGNASSARPWCNKSFGNHATLNWERHPQLCQTIVKIPRSTAPLVC